MEPVHQNQPQEKKTRRKRPQNEEKSSDDEDKVQILELEDLRTILETHFDSSGMNKVQDGKLKELLMSYFTILYYTERQQLDKIDEQTYKTIYTESQDQKDNIKNVDKEVLKKMYDLVHESVTIKTQEYMRNYDLIDQNIEDILSKLTEDQRLQNFSIDKDDNKPIHIAVLRNHEKVIDKLIENKCDINVKNKNNDNVLHLAIQKEHTLLAHKLIDYGVDINSENLQKKTPIFLASEHKNMSIFLRLVEMVQDINHQDDQQRTILLSISMYFPQPELLEIVLQKGCDVNAVDKDGNNSLMLLLIHDKTREFCEADDESEEEDDSLDNDEDDFNSIDEDEEELQCTKQEQKKQDNNVEMEIEG